MGSETVDADSRDMEQMGALAKTDLAQRLAIGISQVKLLETRRVTWPDTRLGCPKKGMDYEETPQKGGLIRLRAGNRIYFYHWGGNGDPFLCEVSPLSHQPPDPGDPGEWVPPPGLDTQ